VTETRSRETLMAGEGDMPPRFHGAHRLTGEAGATLREPAPDLLRAVAGQATAEAVEQLQRQAAELADQLQARQRDVSRREARLHAQAAAREIKEEGAPNRLFDRLAADPRVGFTREELKAIAKGSDFAGRASAQVDEFLAEHVDPIRSELGEGQAAAEELRV